MTFDPNSLLDDFVSAYFGDATLLQDVEYDNDFGHYITYYDDCRSRNITQDGDG